ncbi:hypothetical protein [Tropicimonas sp. IMCC6043]|uniref:hypothetical protein n=1 Tax=Tropicimonas sp. IMCC6043 TaxID=2510645 RepID=UPI00101D917B|nr:hypothetical protein [Tropicimonas sp. IMCC6043]RYH06241.1 hypothetical protein EU800_24525 [Tropicimonas sp. IMCC6043]
MLEYDHIAEKAEVIYHLAAVVNAALLSEDIGVDRALSAAEAFRAIGVMAYSCATTIRFIMYAETSQNEPPEAQ